MMMRARVRPAKLPIEPLFARGSKAVLRQIEQVWSKVSLRERGLIAGLSLVLCVFAAVETYSISVRLSDDAQIARFTRVDAEQRLKALSGDTSRQDVAGEIAKLRDGAFIGPTYSIAGISAQTAFSRWLDDAGVSGFRILAEGDLFGAGELRLQSFRIQAPFNWNSFVPFLKALSEADESVTITSLSVMNGPSANFSMRVTVVLAEAAKE
jgi:type II secretory pathway component PulM